MRSFRLQLLSCLSIACVTSAFFMMHVAYAIPEIRIAGIGIEEPGSRSWVIIESNSSSSEVYYQGDTIPGIGLISTIRKNCIDLVDTQGETKSSCLQGKQSATDNTLSKHAASLSKGSFSNTLHRLETRDLLELSANIQGWLGNGGKAKTAHDRDGKPSGLLIEEISEKSYLSALRFQKGDVIRALNGRDVRSVEDLSGAVLQFRGEVIEFEIIKKNENATRDIRISDSALADIAAMEKGL